MGFKELDWIVVIRGRDQGQGVCVCVVGGLVIDIRGG